jgi:hypothetical protein
MLTEQQVAEYLAKHKGEQSTNSAINFPDMPYVIEWHYDFAQNRKRFFLVNRRTGEEIREIATK